jgi:hypothetical protein
MALWNQRRKETRQKASRIGLVFLFLCVSISFLLVVFSSRSAERSAMDKKNARQQVIVQPDVTAKNFPTPSPTVKAAEHIRYPRAALPTVVVTMPVSTPPGIVYPAITGGTWSAPNVVRAAVKIEKKHRARVTTVRKQLHRSMSHKTIRMKVTPIATTVPTATATPIATVTILIPIPATVMPAPIITPTATATASGTPMPTVQDPPVPPQERRGS